MKSLLIIHFFIATYLQPQPSVRQLRRLYQNASTQKQAAEQLKKMVEGIDASAPATMVGYKGVASMMMAQYGGSPISKYRMFNSGKNLIATAIKKDSLNVETRLLRYTMQYHAPAFLGYRSELKADKAFLKANFASIKDDELKTMVEKVLSIDAKN